MSMVFFPNALQLTKLVFFPGKGEANDTTGTEMPGGEAEGSITLSLYT